MEQLFDAIRSVVDAGINQDWSQLASGIAGIVENGVIPVPTSNALRPAAPHPKVR